MLSKDVNNLGHRERPGFKTLPHRILGRGTELCLVLVLSQGVSELEFCYESKITASSLEALRYISTSWLDIRKRPRSKTLPYGIRDGGSELCYWF